MIGYLRGEVLEHQDGKLLLGVGSGDGHSSVGYALSVPASAEYGALAAGKRAEFYVYTHVREDVLDLYGFASRAEKDLFLSLLSVTGIGPKGALAILSGTRAADLIEAILNEDKELLTRIPGVGKKTAERVVLELADPIRKKVEAGVFHDPRRASGATTRNRPVSHEPDVERDAKAALLGLGFREHDIQNLLNRVLAEATGTPRVEDVVRAALRQLT